MSKEKKEIFEGMGHYKLVFILVVLVILAVAFPSMALEFLKAGILLTVGFFMGFTVGKKT